MAVLCVCDGVDWWGFGVVVVVVVVVVRGGLDGVDCVEELMLMLMLMWLVGCLFGLLF